MKEPLTIRPRPTLPAVIALLETTSLPAVDIRDERLEHFFLAATEGCDAGLVGLEFYGNDALLRSLVVDERERGQGLGIALVRHAENYAASQGVQSIYLLTTTAEGFFQRLGYARCDRMAAPASIRGTTEFASLCPESSALLVKTL